MVLRRASVSDSVAEIVLAAEIAALAAVRATDEDIRALEDISRSIDGTLSDQAHRAMCAFHVRLTEACGNPILQAAMSPILSLVEPGADLDILSVVQAVKARDPVRARASTALLLQSAIHFHGSNR